MEKERVYGKKAKISFYVEFADKEKIKGIALQNNQSVSEFLQHIIKHVLKTNIVKEKKHTVSEIKTAIASVRLTAGEHEYLYTEAEKLGMSASSYIGFILRGFVSDKTSFTKDEVFYLERILGQIGKIGSNVNQGIKLLRKNESTNSSEISILLKNLESLGEQRELLRAVIKNNYTSWQNFKKMAIS